MKNILFTAPDGALPEVSSPAYELLSLLYGSDEINKLPRDFLCSELGGGFRAYLQQLMGEHYQHWLIHTKQETYNNKKQTFYWLDERHFSCNWEQDKDARTIARKQYKDRSYYGTKRAVERLERAKSEKADADKEYQQRIKSKKPTKD